MKKFLGIIFLCLLWSNVGVAAEELNKNCIRKGTTIFNKEVKPHVTKNFVTVMYFGCKSMASWYWHRGKEKDLDTSHQVAYKKCLKGASEYKIETCHLFSINDTIVYGKDAAFVAEVEKEAKAKLTTKVAKKQTKPEDAEKLNKNCIRKGTTIFNKEVKPLVNNNFVTVMYFGCKSMSSWSANWRQSLEEDLDTSHEIPYKECLKGASERKIENCHLFSINDTIVYGKDAAFVAEVEKEAKAKLTTKATEKLNEYCIKKGKKVFNEKAKPWAKKKEFALVMYFYCKGKDDWHFYLGYEDDYDKANETAYNICASKYNIACHLFSISDKIVYGKDATFVAKAKEKVEKRLAKISETRKKSGSGFYVYQVALSDVDQEDFFTKKSPTTFKKITFKEEKSIGGIRKAEKLADVGKNKKKTFKSFTFAAEYEDNITVEIFIEYHKGAKNFERAEFLASYYANMFGQMPHFLKVYTDKIYVHKDIGKDDGVWYAVPNKREFHINRSRCARDSSFVYSRCAVVMMHELAHILQEITGIISPSKWNKARKLDKNYCSEYAKTNSWEDFAESVMCWVAVRHKPDKLKKDDVKKIKEYLANRFKFFDEMNWNVYPVES